MNRCLHITIHERAGAEPPSTTASLPDATSTDPGTNVVMPPVDGRLAAGPSAAPPGANPGGAAACGAAGETLQACSCACAAPACPGQNAAKGSPAPASGVTP